MLDEFGNPIDPSVADLYGYGTDTSTQDPNLLSAGDLAAADATALEPFNDVMAQAVNSTGQVPTPVSGSTSGLSQLFHDLVVAPSGQANTGSTVGNILNYFSRSLNSQPSTPQQAIVKNGVSGVLNGSSSLFSSPIFWIVVLAVLGLVIWLIKRK